MPSTGKVAIVCDHGYPRRLRPAISTRHPVGDRRDLTTDAVEMAEIERGRDQGRSIGRLSHNHTPGIHDHRATVAPLSRRVLADLTGGNHEHLVLDGASADERLPVVTPRGEGERGRHHD